MSEKGPASAPRACRELFHLSQQKVVSLDRLGCCRNAVCGHRKDAEGQNQRFRVGRGTGRRKGRATRSEGRKTGGVPSDGRTAFWGVSRYERRPGGRRRPPFYVEEVPSKRKVIRRTYLPDLIGDQPLSPLEALPYFWATKVREGAHITSHHITSREGEGNDNCPCTK